MRIHVVSSVPFQFSVAATEVVLKDIQVYNLAIVEGNPTFRPERMNALLFVAIRESAAGCNLFLPLQL
jgi:hypothetical protein